MFLKNNISDYSKLDKEIANTKSNGGLSTTEFECAEFHEYTVTPTTFAPAGAPMPGTEAFGQTPWGAGTSPV
jgi:hypothetical protein